MKTKLDTYEQNIENNMAAYTSAGTARRKQVGNIISRAKKSRSISLRINGFDLELIKEKAEENGIPYQTLITNIIHRYATNQLYDKNEMLKSIKIMKEIAV